MATQLACEVFADVEDLDCDCDQEVSDPEKLAILEAASDLLVQLTGGAFRGRCTQKFRPCSTGCGCMLGCCCLDQIPLPGLNPTVTEVKIGGAVLAASSYMIKDGRYLVRVATGDRPSPWPRSQKLWRPDTEPDTFSVTVQSGFAPDAIAKRATLEIACDMLTRNTLGGYVTQAVMDGLTVARDRESTERLDEAGFNWLARFIRSYSMVHGSQAYSPDLTFGWTLHTVE